ncbi:HAD hydrolase-like protein, partial [uncultured Akkermansia sp.]|uniref:HAD family hydrolase n=1 Tax=uncultured Akkermansia sp. TaxID=512294 RepID=UPI002613C496
IMKYLVAEFKKAEGIDLMIDGHAHTTLEEVKKATGGTCMVGDSAHDGNTAVNAGTRLVLVGWGYSSRSALDAFRVPVCAAAGELSARLHDESSLPFPVAAHKNS